METNYSIFIHNGKYSDKWNLRHRNDNLETLKHSFITQMFPTALLLTTKSKIIL